jgi:hypothetical protein
MLTDVDTFCPLLGKKAPIKFVCEKCDYKCSKKRDYERHVLTLKHKNVDKMSKNVDKVAHFFVQCMCGKNYKHRQSLSVHKKKCNVYINLKNIIMEKEKEIEQLKVQMALDEQEQQLVVKKDECLLSNEVVMELIKQNKELQQMLYDQNNKMFEIAKEGKYITNNTTNNFNLNVFLNDKCKDAMTLMDFVESLQVNVKHLEYTSQVGYVEGVSHIFIDGMKDVDVHYRPLHCSDFRREILYIKNVNGWEKEDENRSHITKAIKMINNKSLKQIIEWQKMYPDYNDPESKTNDRYMKMLCNVISGSTEEEQEANFNKVIRNVAKEVVINKKIM